ncbi:12829_t:CDS:10 [Acaulospora colombiana]|uniref:12829_t:CDS:1 n=1 Tax=Acaulospora colombiana TaxID=27376 RepID=A0ACA9KTJ2_9GLOM|nr:12829_t:CDS:10 [Acaulospora colombiana]
MNSSKHAQALAELDSPDPAVRVKALRFIKNNIIGNKTKKDLYISLNIIPKLVSFFKNKEGIDPQVQIQAAIVLGSFAYGGENNVAELAKHGAVKPLLECISIKNDPRLIEAAARALKAIYKCPKADKNDIFQDAHLRDLIILLNPDSLNPKTDREKIASVHTSELAATIIARCCETNEQQIQIESAGAFPALVKLLVCGFSKAQEAALDALAYLCRENSEFGKAIVETKSETNDSPVRIMLNLIRDKSPTMQLVSAKCLTHLSRANAITEYFNDITLTVLPTLVKLLDEKGPVREEAPQVLAYLIRDNEELQKAACDSGAILKLADFVTHVADQENSYYDPLGDSDKLKENALMALAAISSLTDDGRKLLLSDESTDVQKTACATICNIVLEFSPMKRIIIEQGGIEKLVELVQSSDNTLRLNAIWALKNLVYNAESEIKDSVMKALTYPTLETLIMDQEVDIQEKALNLLRNLACTKPYDIEEVFKGLGENCLMDIIENKLCSWNEEIIKQGVPTPHRLRSSPGRIRELRQLGFEDMVKSMMNDENLDVREKAKTALSQFSQV